MRMRRIMGNESVPLRRTGRSGKIISCTGKPIRLLVLVAISFIIHHSSLAQLDSWQSHFSYQSGQSVAVVGSKIYAATRNGFFYYDKTTNETVTLDKTNGLSEVSISRLLYLADQKRLLIAYQSGNLDFLTVSSTGESGDVKNSNTILTAPNLPAARAIQHLNRVGNNVYLSTDFGLVVLDIVRDEIRDTYFSPAPNGRLGTVIYSTVVAGDTLFALAGSGNPGAGLLLQAVRLAPNVNIADPANWRLVAAPDRSITSISSSSGRLVASVNERGVYERQNGRWVLTRSLPDQAIKLFSAPDGYSLATDQTITLPNSTTFSGPLLTSYVQEVVADGDQVWVADPTNGLLAGRAGAFERIVPEGPVLGGFTNLYAYPRTLVALSETAFAGPHVERYSVLDGRWQSITIPNYRDIGFIDAVYLPTEQRLYLVGGRGLWSLIDGQLPTPVALPGTVGSSITSLATDRDGNLWLGAPGQRATLYVRRPDGTFLTFPVSNSSRMAQLTPDDNGFIWFVNRSSTDELTVFDPQTARSRSFFIRTNALVKDRTGAIWIGTSQGPLVFDNPADAFDARINPQTPLLNGRRLLGNERVNAIAVDGGNRKWLGTSNGLYLVSPDGSQLLETFTTANSPLPDNNVQRLTIEPVSGRVFILSGQGSVGDKLVSYGGSATEPTETLSKLTIFPNPVRPDFSGTVSINGLTDNATVKVLDAGGQLVYETRSQGGTATWNLRDYRNRPAQTGVYLIVVVAADGTEGVAGKLAVVR